MAAKRLTRPAPGHVPLIKFGIYGTGGSGKTTLMATAHLDERTSPLLVIDVGGNPDMLLYWGEAPWIIQITKYEEINPAFDFLRTGQKENHRFRKEFDIPPDVVFKSVGIDLFSDWQRMAIESVTGTASSPILTNVTEPEATKHGNKIQTLTVHVARSFLMQLPMHVFLTLQQKEFVDFSGGGKTHIEPFLYGAARTLVPHWIKLMGRMEQVAQPKDGKRRIVPRISWQSSTQDGVTKNQIAPAALGGPLVSHTPTANLGEYMIDPTMTKILDTIEKFYNNLQQKELK